MEQGIKDYLKKLRNTFTKVKNKDKKVLVNQYLDVLIKLFRNLDFLSKFKRVIKKIIMATTSLGKNSIKLFKIP